MLIAKPTEIAAFFLRNGQPLIDEVTKEPIRLPYTLAAEANFNFAIAAGLLPFGKTLQELEPVIYNMPGHHLWDSVDALSVKRRDQLTQIISDELSQRMGRKISLPFDALPLVWRSSSIFQLEQDKKTGESRVRFNVRSHRNALTIARLLPGGSGYMAVSPAGEIESAEDGAVRKLQIESGITIHRGDIVPLGYAMNEIPRKMPMLSTIYSGSVPGFMTEFTYVGYTQVAPNNAQSLVLNADSFGSISYSYDDLRTLSEGRTVDATFHKSQAPFATVFVDNVRRNVENAGKPFTLDQLVDHAARTGLMAPSDYGQSGKLDFADPVPVTIMRKDFIMGGWNGVAVAMEALQHAGHPASRAELDYVSKNSCIDLTPGECERGLKGALLPADRPLSYKPQP